MSTIPASAIVNIIPGVLSAGGTALALSGLLLTSNPRVPTGSVQPFASASAVATFFGASSQEAADAVIYFNGFDNSTAKPGNMWMAQYPLSPVAAWMRGGSVAALSLTALQAISGTLAVTVDGTPHTAGALNLSAATSFSSAAAIIQTALAGSETTVGVVTGSIAGTVFTVSAVTSGTIAVGQTLTGAGILPGTIVTALGTGTGGIGTYTVSLSQTVASETITDVSAASTPLTVSYDSVGGGFVIYSGTAGASSSMAFATGTTAAALALTSATGATLSQGALAGVPATYMNAALQVTQNWATFATLFDPDQGAGNTQKLAFVAWNNTQNNRFMYVAWDADLSPTTTVPATTSLGYLISQAGYSGSFLLGAQTSEAQAVMVCGFCASINTAAANGRQTLAFKSQAGMIANVTSQQVGANLISNGYNFYGAYGAAATTFVFLYPGQVSGKFLWADSYINEVWLNNALQLAILNLMKNIGSLPYNSRGYSLVESACFDPINQALIFGAIQVGVTLTAAQIAAVNTSAGMNVANILQNRGWYLQIQDAPPNIRIARGSPVCLLWYVDGQSIQAITLSSINVQ